MLLFTGGNKFMGDKKKIKMKGKETPNIFGLALSVFGLPVDRNIIFSSHKNVYRKKIEKRQRGLLVKISFLKYFLDCDEKILLLTTGHSAVKFWELLLTFPAFFFLRKALFVFTTKRIFIIPTTFKFAYRQTQLQIRYADCHRIAIKGRSLLLFCKDGERKVFHYIGGSELKKIKHLIQHLPIKDSINPEIAIQHLCPSCSNLLNEDTNKCVQCNLAFKDPYYAILRTILLPGGGFFYGRYHLYGTLMGIFEMVIIISLTLAGLMLHRDSSHINLFILLLISMALMSVKFINAYHASRLLEHPIPEEKEFDRNKK